MVHSEMSIEVIPLQFCRTLAEIIRRILKDQERPVVQKSLTGEHVGAED